ncbi:site-specific DNA-methyltransferase [Hydrogenimonas thermophila]|uniref:site-specific DNA-methyltransferase n=1 Tax=Hydrogenimonas thermophila TaxID=223786 RepID=UPI0029371053|nr:site-specific DNA-methyltransferase [Hydrogenimonas thermophila]WOE71124.1 site-specific DNA-methyltransferase [Hydrogenimonas thermophila]WOE73642.1 site-specific DNA-methyltransferase [Hydrogenimonas thermophila]
MQKLKLGTKNLADENIKKLSEIFPNVVKEGKVDFELLKQLLSDSLIEDCRERYGLNWVGKKESILKANSRVVKTLRPIKEKSIDFENTKNLYIEGDNFEVLKVIQESYLNKIKMIYIDPPYNTGKDFIYKDNFTQSKDEYLRETEAVDEEGVKLYKNTDTNGRFHSDWLSMMYERLLIARDLLREDGVIFISIDDNEVHNLRHLCDEVFGEGNFFGVFIWQKRSGSMDSVDNISIDHEYILCYGKIKNKLKGVERKFENYKNPDNDSRGPWIADNLSAGKSGGNVYYEIVDPNTGNKFLPPPGRYWPYNPSTMERKIKEGRILFPKDKNGRPMLKRFKYEAKSNFLPVSTIMRNYTDKKLPNNAIISALNTKGTTELQNLFNNKIFTFPKSIILLKSLINQVVEIKENDIIIDFFSGSATTAHAVMELNAEDGGNRQFIMVQIPEFTDEKSEAYKAGFRTICDIGRERIVRAGKKIKEDFKDKEYIDSLDFGFRYFKIESSNFKEAKDISEITQENLFDTVDNIKPDRNDLDLLFEVILSLGLELTLKIESKEILGKRVYFVEENSLIACFDDAIDENLAKELAEFQPLKIVLKDSSFIDDSDKINFEQTLKELSPETDVWVV